MAARILTFISRATKLRWRVARDYQRWATKTGAFSNPNRDERNRLIEERDEERSDDERWKRCHGPIVGGGTVVDLPGRIEEPVSEQGAGNGAKYSEK